jgi:hypothetical protein
MPNKKVSQLPVKSSNLLATDLLEVSEINTGVYTSKKINGQQIVDGVLSNISAPTLESVTDIGNTTTNNLQVRVNPNWSGVEPNNVYTLNTTASTSASINNDGSLVLKAGTQQSTLKNTNVTNSNLILEFPNKVTGSYTLSTTDDLIDNRISEVFRGFTFNNNYGCSGWWINCFSNGINFSSNSCFN